MKFTIGKALSGRFWYTNFWVPDPPSPPSNTSLPRPPAVARPPLPLSSPWGLLVKTFSERCVWVHWPLCLKSQPKGPTLQRPDVPSAPFTARSDLLAGSGPGARSPGNDEHRCALLLCAMSASEAFV